jgi:hypothetical protein
MLVSDRQVRNRQCAAAESGTQAGGNKLKEDITSADIGSLVNENNKMFAGKMSQTRTSENAGAPLMAPQTVAAAPAASETWRRTKLSSRVLPRGATGVAGRTTLAVRPSGLGKNPKTQLRSVPLTADPGKVDKLFRDLLQFFDIERSFFRSRDSMRSGSAPGSRTGFDGAGERVRRVLNNSP